MDNSVINFIIFLIFTFIYFSKIRNKATLKDYSSNEGIESYYNSINSSLFLYFMLIILTQLITNVIVISNMCGGSFKQNLGYTSIITLIPWTLIFGILIIILIAFPNFKNAFSDIVGYYSVSEKANVILTELLNHSSNEVEGYTELIVDENKDGTNKELKTLNKLENEIKAQSTDLISEIFSNLSLLINKITPVNFNEYWETLRPLMKPKYAKLTSEQDKYCYEISEMGNYNNYLNKMPKASSNLLENMDLNTKVQTGGTKKYLEACRNKMIGGNSLIKVDNEAEFSTIQNYCQLKQNLLNLVVYRDNIGEAMWYIYTGLLLSTILKYNINNRGCVKSISQIQTNLNTTLTSQQQENALAQAQQRVYTIS